MILGKICAETRVEVERRKRALPVETLAASARAAGPTRGFARALRAPRETGRGGPGQGPLASLACVGEFKRKSPSAGWINQGAAPAAVAAAYQAAGASALSVLTDAPFFGGSLDDLRAARAACTLPVLRKDFILDAYQLVEARAAGADAVLLIVAALDDTALRALLAEGLALGLDVLVEAHDEGEVRRAVDAGATLVGVNHRDLRTFEMDMTLAVRMRPLLPPGTTVVAESGLGSAEDLRRMADAGIDAVLVGERLMRGADPGAALKNLYAVPGER